VLTGERQVCGTNSIAMFVVSRRLEVTCNRESGLHFFGSVSGNFTTVETNPLIKFVPRNTTSFIGGDVESSASPAAWSLTAIDDHVYSVQASRDGFLGPIAYFAYTIYTTPVAITATPTNDTKVSTLDPITLFSLSAYNTIFYTLDNTSPNSGSLVYTSPLYFNTTGTVTIRANAWKDGNIPVWGAESLFVFDIVTARVPVPSVAETDVIRCSLNMNLASVDEDVKIFYSFGESPPAPNLQFFFGDSIVVNNVTTILVKAMGEKNNINGSIYTFTYVIRDSIPAAVVPSDTKTTTGINYLEYYSNGTSYTTFKFMSPNPCPSRPSDYDKLYFAIGGTTPDTTTPFLAPASGIPHTTPAANVTIKMIVVRGLESGTVNTVIMNMGDKIPNKPTISPMNNSIQDTPFRFNFTVDSQEPAGYAISGYEIYYAINTFNSSYYMLFSGVQVAYANPGTTDLTFLVRAYAVKNGVEGPGITANFSVLKPEVVEVCDPLCGIHGTCQINEAIKYCACDAGWKGDDCKQSSTNDLVVVVDNNVALVAALGVAGAGLVAVVLIARHKITHKSDEEFAGISTGGAINMSPKLPSVYARIKSNPDFVFPVEYEKTILGRTNKEDHVDLDLSNFDGIDLQRLSRKHATISLSQGADGECFMITCYGKHGITVDSVKLAMNDTAVLYNKSLVKICGSMLVFRDDQHKNMELPAELLKANMKATSRAIKQQNAAPKTGPPAKAADFSTEPVKKSRDNKDDIGLEDVREL
jgi:hypothetical protein